MTRVNSRTDHFIAWFVLATFIGLTAAVSAYVWHMSRLADRARFENAVQSTNDAVLFRLETYVNVLRAASGLFAMNHDATPADVRQFVNHLNIQRRYPGIQGIGLTLRVAPSEVAGVEAQMREEFSDFRIWPPGQRAEYHTIVLLEPLDRRNRAAIGYDMYTDAVRRAAMDRARETGKPTASGRVTLVQEIEARKQSGFLIYVPLYSTRTVPATSEERRSKCIGFIYAPFRSNDLLQGVLGTQENPEVVFEMFDGGQQLFSSGTAVAVPRYVATNKVESAGRKWTIRYSSRRSAGGGPLFLTIATVLSGLLISSLVFALILVQIAARSRAEQTAEQLRASESELQQANRAKDEFLATLSHELRTPMTSIIGWSRMMATADLDVETTALAIDAIQTSGKAQAQLIDDLLDVSRITAGKMRIEKRSLDLRLVVDAAVNAIGPAAVAKSIDLDVDVPIAPVTIDGDAARLQQVVLNLLTNAMKFTPVNGRVTISLTTQLDEARIEVADNGQGVDPAFLPLVFDRFQQADSSTTRAYTGLGLGLAIVRHLVELHGGRVVAASEGIGKGASFSVHLPLDQSSRAVTAALLESSDDERATLHGAQLLIVDDEESVRNYVATAFSRSGSQLRVVSSGDDALRAMQQWLPDAILTDIGMPRMDGYEVLARVRASPELASVPIVALTAYARTEDRDRATAAGFDAFITKPVEPLVLLKEVARVIRFARTKNAGPSGPAQGV